MKVRLCAPVLLLVAATAAAAAADVLIVLNKSDHEAALVDPATYEVVTKLPTGKGPHEAAASPDGRYVYVSNYGSFAVFREGERPQMQPGTTLTVIDLEERKVKATLDLGSYKQPHGIHVSRDGSRLWVTCEGSKAVLELDAASGRVLKAWETGQDVSHMVVPTPDENKLYVANIGSGSVTVIDRTTDIVKSVPTGTGAEGIDVSPDGREVWVSNRGANSVSVIDAAKDRVLVTFESGGKMPIRVKFTRDGNQVWVSNARSNTVTVFDRATRQLVDSIEVGAVPVGILMTPDGQRAFVANTNDNKVTVVDVATRKVIKTFTTGTEPDGMAWAD
ncbi:MAG TPA: beta-propeller fold lactonase family protein [Candidatus Xenobia bacterium]|nr:beta-propeller fold lactonase family protein [Candidatus Xenobia bacterium]